MRRFCTYTRLNLKRILRYAPFVFIVTLVLCVCLSVALITVVNLDNSGEDQEKMKVGLVGNFENSFVEFGISAIKSFDSSRGFMEIEELDEQNAREKLFDGEILAYVVIPDGFVDDAMHGKIGKLRFVTREANANIVNLFKAEVLELISCILVESQNGVFALETLMRENGFKSSEVYETTEEMAMEYVGLIVSRSNALETEIIGVFENLTFAGYMFSGILILLILLSGIVCAPFFIRRDFALPKLMRANGYGVHIQTAGEYLAFFSVTAITSFVFSFFMMYGCAKGEIIPELFGFEIAEILIITLKFMLGIALVAAMQYLFYQLSGSVVSGVLLQFISAVILGYLSGCFYPISFFPKAIRIISDALPSGMAREYLSALIMGKASVSQIIIIVAYTVVLLELSALIRRRRIREA